MSQTLIEQFNEKDMSLLDQMDDLIESAELELQRTATLLDLNVNTEEAFKDVLAITKEIESIALKLKQNDTRMVATEKIGLFTQRFNEVMDQVKK